MTVKDLELLRQVGGDLKRGFALKSDEVSEIKRMGIKHIEKWLHGLAKNSHVFADETQKLYKQAVDNQSQEDFEAQKSVQRRGSPKLANAIIEKFPILARVGKTDTRLLVHLVYILTAVFGGYVLGGGKKEAQDASPYGYIRDVTRDVVLIANTQSKLFTDIVKAARDGNDVFTNNAKGSIMDKQQLPAKNLLHVSEWVRRLINDYQNVTKVSKIRDQITIPLSFVQAVVNDLYKKVSGMSGEGRTKGSRNKDKSLRDMMAYRIILVMLVTGCRLIEVLRESSIEDAKIPAHPERTLVVGLAKKKDEDQSGGAKKGNTRNVKSERVMIDGRMLQSTDKINFLGTDEQKKKKKQKKGRVIVLMFNPSPDESIEEHRRWREFIQRQFKLIRTQLKKNGDTIHTKTNPELSNKYDKWVNPVVGRLFKDHWHYVKGQFNSHALRAIFGNAAYEQFGAPNGIARVAFLTEWLGHETGMQSSLFYLHIVVKASDEFRTSQDPAVIYTKLQAQFEGKLKEIQKIYDIREEEVEHVMKKRRKTDVVFPYNGKNLEKRKRVIFKPQAGETREDANKRKTKERLDAVASHVSAMRKAGIPITTRNIKKGGFGSHIVTLFNQRS